METRFVTMKMLRVFTSKGIVMFESIEDAEEYVSMMEEKGKLARLNIWRWATQIEK